MKSFSKAKHFPLSIHALRGLYFVVVVVVVVVLFSVTYFSN